MKGIRLKNGEWRPSYACTYSPLFQWPIRPLKIIQWLFGYPGYLWPLHLMYTALAFVTWYFLQPDLSQTASLQIRWIIFMFLRNLGFIWLVFGGFHLLLYTLKLHGTEQKYNPKWQAVEAKRFLFNNQVYDNIFRTCVSGCAVWTAYEVLYILLLSRGLLPFLAFRQNPVWFILFFFLIPIWREVHFYLTHRLLHWKPLMKRIHSVHHWNANPGPWSGMAMHPLEHILYLSVVLVHFIVPSHPVHFFFNSQLTALTPANGHTGFEGPLFKGWLPSGSYFHYLHHRYVSCNFGETTVPLDRWFGRFYDGTGKYEFKAKAFH